jgi:hypothetical protein
MDIIISSSDFVADPDGLVREMREGRIIHFSDVGYTLGPSSGFSAVGEENDEAEDMVSLPKDVTGVEGTVFVSTKGCAHHVASVKIAVDPPDALNATSKSASMSIADCKIMGEYVDLRLAEQAKQFIGRNREALLSYWNCEIDTAELIKRLKAA